MRLLPADERALQAALRLAEAAVGLASPNPTVGCVLMRDALKLGEGAHVYDRRDHAEIVALKAAWSAGHDVRGATAFVTLEPCAHHGRTGPCADALVEAGVARCVVATVDPNPLVCGQGLARLHQAGVQVLVADPGSAIAVRARRVNDSFAFAVQHGRPFVTLKAAVSVDGKLAPPPNNRRLTEPYWLTGSAARTDVQGLRHANDAILTGIGTVLADDPTLTDRTGLPRRRPLQRIVLDPRLRLPLASKLLLPAEEDLIVVAGADAPRSNEAALRSRGADVIRLAGGSGGFDLEALLRSLAERRLNSVLLEGGAGVNGSFLAAGQVDRVVLYYAEAELGANAVPFASGAISPYTLQGKLTSPARATFPNGTGEDVRLCGYLHDPWAGVRA